MFERRNARQVNIGGVIIGNGYPIAIQSMNNTKTADIDATLEQIYSLALAGCDITRVAVPDMDAAKALKEITKKSPIPVVADIHFDHRLAIESIRSNAAKIRINPGNIIGSENLKEVAQAAGKAGIPIRVGVNSGSLKPEYLKKYEGDRVRAMAYSALDSLSLLESTGFKDIVLSVKSSDPLLTIKVYRFLSDKTEYPFHLGVTEAGTKREGEIKSAVGIGTLLAEGIGDTVRVSLTGDPLDEIKSAVSILRSLNLINRGVQIISCPTCGRTSVDLISLVQEAEKRFEDIKEPIKVAIMGCAVNGPGEARDADIGIAGGENEYLLFIKGEIIRKIDEDKALDELEIEVRKIAEKLKKEDNKDR